MSRIWTLIIFIIISAEACASNSSNTLIKKNGIEKFENDCCVKYEEKIKGKEGDYLLKTVFFDKAKKNYYGTEIYYVTSHRIFYHPDRDKFDIKEPESAFKELEQRFNK